MIFQQHWQHHQKRRRRRQQQQLTKNFVAKIYGHVFRSSTKNVQNYIAIRCTAIHFLIRLAWFRCRKNQNLLIAFNCFFKTNSRSHNLSHTHTHTWPSATSSYATFKITRVCLLVSKYATIISNGFNILKLIINIFADLLHE